MMAHKNEARRFWRVEPCKNPVGWRAVGYPYEGTQALREPRVGDRLTFKAATRSHYRKATRLINGFDTLGRPLVNYHGWSDFVVQLHEIISCEPAE